MMTGCLKLAKQLKLEEDRDAGKIQNCSTPGHEEDNCYFRANIENRQPKWKLREAQKKVIEAYNQARKPLKPKTDVHNNPPRRIQTRNATP